MFRLGFPLSVTATLLSSVAALAVTNYFAQLFGAGEEGGYVPVLPGETVYQDFTGTTPATAAGQPVGLVVPADALGDELITGTNSQVYTAYEAFTATGILTQSKLYLIEFDAVGTGSLGIRVGDAGVNDLTWSTGTGHFRAFMLCDTNGTSFRLGGAASGYTGTVTNISVKEVTDPYLIQSVNTNYRPTLARMPESGVRNLMNYSEQLTNAVWSSTAAVTSSITDPLGGNTAIRATYDGDQYDFWGRFTNVSYTTGVTYTASWWARSDNPTQIHLCPSAGVNRSYPFTATGTWTRYTHTWVGDSTDSNFRFQDRTGVAGAQLEIAFVQLEIGGSMTAYQNRVTQYDITETVVDDIWYLKHDGVDDYMTLAGLPVALGSELVTNGDGSSATGWVNGRGAETITATGGRIRITNVTGSTMAVVQQLTGLTIGKTYRLSGSVYATNCGTGYLRMFDTMDLNTTNNIVTTPADASGFGDILANATTMYVGAVFTVSAPGEYGEIDNISVKEITAEYTEALKIAGSQEPWEYGPELFTNYFPTMGEWVNNLDGSFTVTSATTSTLMVDTAFPTNMGDTYRVKFTVVGDTASVWFSGTYFGNAHSTGSYEYEVTATSARLLQFSAAVGETITVSGISVQRISYFEDVPISSTKTARVADIASYLVIDRALTTEEQEELTQQ